MTLPLQTTDQLLEAKDYQNLVVVYRNGAPVRLSDLGRVIDSVEDVRNIGIADGKPAVLIMISRQPNANIIETVDRMRAVLPQFQASLPPTVTLKVDNDRTNTIRASVVDAERNMVISIALVIFVVFVFLRNALGDLHPEHFGAGLADQHVRRDVSAGLYARQPLADGADHRHGIRGGRCDRGDRKHHAPHRKRHAAHAGGAARARRKSASPCFR